MKAALLFLALCPILVLAQRSGQSPASSAATSSEQSATTFWLVGRYDGNRVIVYFDAVQFGGLIPANVQRSIAEPVAPGFFIPVELTQRYLARFEDAPGAEHFALGDEYDLLPGDGATATIRLTTLVGFENDEGAGNDSYIGALGTIEGDTDPLSRHDCYVVRRHQQTQRLPPQVQIAQSLAAAQLVYAPVSLETETQIAALLTKQMRAQTTPKEQSAAESGKIYLRIQPFQTAGGALHYYANAAWKTGKEDFNHPPYALGAWLVAEPALRIVALETRTTGYEDFGLPRLLNVIDLGGGRTGAIFSVQGDDSNETELVEYHDGANLKQMHRYQSIGVGE